MAGSEKVDSPLKSLSPKLQEEVGEAPGLGTNPECAICLQSCVHPVQLPCCHVFCFLCVKGASWHSKRCALCRQEVPEDFLERPVLLSPEELKAAAAGLSRGVGGSAHKDYAWYYEGRNGWWQYDERTSKELEESFSKGKSSTEMLIAGFLYVADLENMVQYRRNEHGRRRKIKRDVVDIPKKGVAGLRLDPEPIPNTLPAERVHLADGSDTSGQPLPAALRFMTSVPPVRPTTLLGHPVTRLHTPTPTLEETFSQLLVSSPEEDVEDDSSSSSEEEADRARGRAPSLRQRRHRQRPLSENQPPRLPPRGAPPIATPVRSRSPDGQCTVTEV
ncbi:E3 ubiquitin-protein ligase rnf146 [Periophthalmus magnuspinnatus]|uniref:E3 ubiquitin-protein ligase rnf146 n=1 Tax=Periophthalmus magnuspinnatus TaxID=409849 RepID=UPI00145A302C|nr:E3 ubiquitin-protein ligase rnf146 [Periophthalmus magnuspinnatus]